jgi:hypothetical protein
MSHCDSLVQPSNCPVSTHQCICARTDSSFLPLLDHPTSHVLRGKISSRVTHLNVCRPCPSGAICRSALTLILRLSQMNLSSDDMLAAMSGLTRRRSTTQQQTPYPFLPESSTVLPFYGSPVTMGPPSGSHLRNIIVTRLSSAQRVNNKTPSNRKSSSLKLARPRDTGSFRGRGRVPAARPTTSLLARSPPTDSLKTTISQNV